MPGTRSTTPVMGSCASTTVTRTGSRQEDYEVELRFSRQVVVDRVKQLEQENDILRRRNGEIEAKWREAVEENSKLKSSLSESLSVAAHENDGLREENIVLKRDISGLEEALRQHLHILDKVIVDADPVDETGELVRFFDSHFAATEAFTSLGGDFNQAVNWQQWWPTARAQCIKAAKRDLRELLAVKLATTYQLRLHRIMSAFDHAERGAKLQKGVTKEELAGSLLGFLRLPELFSPKFSIRDILAGPIIKHDDDDDSYVNRAAFSAAVSRALKAAVKEGAVGAFRSQVRSAYDQWSLSCERVYKKASTAAGKLSGAALKAELLSRMRPFDGSMLVDAQPLQCSSVLEQLFDSLLLQADGVCGQGEDTDELSWDELWSLVRVHIRASCKAEVLDLLRLLLEHTVRADVGCLKQLYLSQHLNSLDAIQLALSCPEAVSFQQKYPACDLEVLLLNADASPLPSNEPLASVQHSCSSASAATAATLPHPAWRTFAKEVYRSIKPSAVAAVRRQLGQDLRASLAAWKRTLHSLHATAASMNPSRAAPGSRPTALRRDLEAVLEQSLNPIGLVPCATAFAARPYP